MKIAKIEERKSNALTKQVYETDLGYTVKVVTIGPDTHITATPLIEVSHIAPRVEFISRESRSLEFKSPTVSMNDIPIFEEWVNKACKLTEYIYNHYDEFVCEIEGALEREC